MRAQSWREVRLLKHQRHKQILRCYLLLLLAHRSNHARSQDLDAQGTHRQHTTLGRMITDQTRAIDKIYSRY